MSAPDYHKAASFHHFERAGWSEPQIVENYDAGFGSLTIQVIPYLLDAVQAARGARILDVATGPGYAAAAAAERGADVVAIDFSAAMVSRAAEQYPGVNFRVGDAQELDFDSATFDAVIINFGLMHFEQPELALREAYRVLRSGGRVGFTVWAGPQKTVAIGLLQNALQSHGNLEVPLPPGTPFFRFSDHEECRQVLGAAGFTNCDVVEVDQIWSFRFRRRVAQIFGGRHRTQPCPTEGPGTRSDGLDSEGVWPVTGSFSGE